MARNTVMVGAWLAGTVAAVALGVEAVDVVTASVTERRPPPLSSRAVTEALAGQPGGVPAPGPDTGPGSDAGTPAEPGSPPAAATRPRTGSATAAATPTTAGRTGTTTPGAVSPTTTPGPVSATGAASPTTTTSVPSTTSTTAPAAAPSTTAAPAPSPPPEDRTFRLVGGTVGVRFENREAHLLWARPEPGFRVDSSGSSSQVDIRFRSDDHESRLKAYWNDGPRTEMEERDL